MIPFFITICPHFDTRRLACLFVLLCTLCPAVAWAQNPLSGCKTYQKIEREEFNYPLVPGTENVHEGRLAGSVRVDCDDMTLFADEIRWRDDSDMVYANGDVHYQQSGTYISAERAEMNRRTHLGTFFEASGTIVLLDKKEDKTLFGTQEPDAMFAADRIDKIADRTYKLTHGSWTTCLQPTPRWEMVASSIIIVSGDHATLKNMVLRVKDVPVFYVPAIYYPTKHEDRATGFLLPSYGSSSVKGLTLSNAFFWAIDRSRDATFYYDWLSKAGQGTGGEYRYAGEAGSSGNGRIYMLNEQAQYDSTGETIERPGHRSFDIRGNINQALPDNLRFNGHVNYFTDVTTQQLYQQNIADFSQRTRSFGAQLSGGVGRYRLSGQFDTTDVFYGSSQASRVGSGPFGSFTIGEKAIGKSHVYFGATANGGYLIRQDNIDDPLSNHSLWRVDAAPRLTVPVSNLPALTTTASASWRYTFWSESLDPELGHVPVNISRNILNLQMRSVGPVFSRVWHTPDNRYADGFKHLIEPSVTLDWLSPFDNSAHIVQLDGVDTVVTGTTTVTYGLVNRVLAKRRLGTPIGQQVPAGNVREVLSIGISQTYYTNSLAAQYDPQYQSSFNGLYEHTVPPSPFSPIRSRRSSGPRTRRAPNSGWNTTSSSTPYTRTTRQARSTSARPTSRWDGPSGRSFPACRGSTTRTSRTIFWTCTRPSRTRATASAGPTRSTMMCCTDRFCSAGIACITTASAAASRSTIRPWICRISRVSRRTTAGCRSRLPWPESDRFPIRSAHSAA